MHQDDDTAHNIWNEMQADAVGAAHRESQERIDKRMKQGLCQLCGKRPHNPAYSAPFCIECAKEVEFVCHSNGCASETAAEYMGVQFCKAHAAEIAHEHYDEYLELKSRLDEMEQEFEDKCADVGFNPRTSNKPYRELSTKEINLVQMWDDVQVLQQSANSQKANVKMIADQIGQVFPENFTVNF